MGKSLNLNLNKAKQVKNDEFYTRYCDIEKGLNHYREQQRGKVIYCNCDDPYQSNFFKYFTDNFNALGLKKLIATFLNRIAYVVEINEVPDLFNDIDYLLENNKNNLIPLKDNGDFRSAECVEFLKQADVVITNPPFSLFREFVDKLVEYDKKFLIVGSKTAVTYKNVFELMKNNKLWFGYGSCSHFRIPTEKAGEFTPGLYNPQTGLVNITGLTRWFTNLTVDKAAEPVGKVNYKQGLYPEYDNYDAIEVSKISEIPGDYAGIMGVPITFFDRYNPKLFEIKGLTSLLKINGKAIFKRLLIKKLI